MIPFSRLLTHTPQIPIIIFYEGLVFLTFLKEKEIVIGQIWVAIIFHPFHEIPENASVHNVQLPQKKTTSNDTSGYREKRVGEGPFSKKHFSTCSKRT